MSGGEPSCAIVVRDLRVLVTAGASGIGRAVASAFAGAGAQVHITDVDDAAIGDAVSEIPNLGGTAGDASSPRDVDRAVADVQTRFGGLDVLVNNVGVAGPTGRIEDYADGDVERTIDVNLTSHFYFLNRCLPLLRGSRRNPSVVAMSSVAGRLGYGFRTPYAATKWAIVGLDKVARRRARPRWGPRERDPSRSGQGPPHGQGHRRPGARGGVSFEAMRNSYLGKISLRRMVEAEDVANLALFLSSDLARNITGQAISVDGNVEYL